MNQPTLFISKSNLSKLFRYTRISKNEVCGVLIGYKIKHNLFQITDIIFDSDSYNQSPFSIIRNTSSLYSKIQDLVRNTEKNVDYIGDWHSHPKGSCKYSQIDYKSMNDMLRDEKYNFLNEIILIITNQNLRIKSYIFHRNSRKPSQCILKIVK
ncbi:Mov34/MPN/PAD-1 family protein [Candidatus Harpocratesius sp.]